MLTHVGVKKLPRLILPSREAVLHAPDTRHDRVSQYAQGVDVLLSEHAQSCILPLSKGTRFKLYIGNMCAAVSSGLLSGVAPSYATVDGGLNTNPLPGITTTTVTARLTVMSHTQ